MEELQLRAQARWKVLIKSSRGGQKIFTKLNQGGTLPRLSTTFPFRKVFVRNLSYNYQVTGDHDLFSEIVNPIEKIIYPY